MTTKFNNSRYKIKTTLGFEDFTGIQKISKPAWVSFKAQNSEKDFYLKCSPNHRVAISDSEFITAEWLDIGTMVKVKDGYAEIKEVKHTYEKIELYDVIDAGAKSSYYTNDILSHNCQFIGSGNTLISPRKLGEMSYINPLKSFENVDYYEMPRPGHTYFLVADTARGMRLDYSAFVVIDVSTLPYKLVAKFRNNEISPMIYPYFINNIGRYYNNAYVLMELNDAGEQVAVSLLNDHEYENIIRCDSKGASGYRISLDGQGKLGVMQSVATKTKGCSNLKSLIEADKLIIEDFEAYMELTTFVKKEITSQKFEAEPGCHDDIVICLVLFAWAAGSEEWKAIMGGDIAQSMYGQKLLTMDDLMPVGFLSINTMRQNHIDTQGQVWVEARQNDPPSWYGEIYHNFDPMDNF